jgi:regulator of nucleoside diphosphate kinase
MQIEFDEKRQLTQLDVARIRKLLGSRRVDELARLLDEAEVVEGPQVDPHVITMYTQFEIEEPESGRRHQLAVCYPQDAEPSKGFISVLSPLGRSALGLRAGAHLSWVAPAGPANARIAAVLFQPEASGDYLT